MTWPAYPDYKATDVEWMGSLPVSWRLLPVKRVIARVESGTSVNAADVPASPGEIAVLKTSCVYSGEFAPAENKTVYDPAEMARVTCPLRSGTLIVSRMNTPDLVGAAGYVRSSVKGLNLPDRLWQITFNENADARWVHYWTKTPSYRDQIRAICVGTSSSMQNISQADFGSLVLALPSRHEQAVIADFLDAETAKIDALIAKQEQLIATLREDRAATISHAVCTGIDSAVVMTTTTCEWVDRVPPSWRLTPLKRVISFQEGPGIMAEDFRDEGVPLLRVASVSTDIATLNGCNYLDPDQVRATWSRFQVELGDLLVSASASIGIVAEVGPEVEGAIPYTGIIRIFPGPKLRRDFMKWYLVSGPFMTQIDRLKQGSTIQHFGPTHLSRMRLHVPPLDEQDRISNYLRTRCAGIDTVVDKAVNLIKTMREYRSALITDAVTGKIDVRGAA